MFLSINLILYSLFPFFFLITGCVSLGPSRIQKPDDASTGGMVLISIADWQNMRGIGVTEGVKNAIVNEYISSMINCRTRFQSIDRKTIEFYIFQYLDYIQEGGPHGTEFICNPFIENVKRKQSRYGILEIESSSETNIMINEEPFDIRFSSFILMPGEYTIHVRSGNKVICRRSVKIESSRVSRMPCKPSIS